ncbi:MAG TPA: restriction endonuclease subunit S, partial [Flavisolibacter sp.]|nr:restriction endonuclease subunit S [Flavisolibacter sp.]
MDNLIQKKQQLITKLEEEKTAVINEAITKGLNPDAPMKDSGIDWLGKVPTHWALSKIAYVTNVVRGASPRPAGDPKYFNGSHTPWITVAEVTKDGSKFITDVSSYLTEDGKSQSRFIQSGTLVLSNSGATLGVPKILKIDGCINDGSVAFLNIADNIKQEFLYYFLKSLTYTYREMMKGSGQPNLNTDIVKSTNLAIPPV